MQQRRGLSLIPVSPLPGIYSFEYGGLRGFMSHFLPKSDPLIISPLETIVMSNLLLWDFHILSSFPLNVGCQ